jgi:hypothetical protein
VPSLEGHEQLKKQAQSSSITDSVGPKEEQSGQPALPASEYRELEYEVPCHRWLFYMHGEFLMETS